MSIETIVAQGYRVANDAVLWNDAALPIAVADNNTMILFGTTFLLVRRALSMTQTSPITPSRTTFWIGHAVSAFPVLMLFASGAMKLAKPDFVVKGMSEHGYPENLILGL